ncbi:hypothetical protein [Bowmanella yangjiangensis]|uniref:Uncharacterized protein n=1 Tax=Bowmanella yangjiangensis TaxID=2811230 RepID=A0ABS3CQ83_9ALTE|nr:hypothetical protein [Bowmanella yangjiangensis]MBN7819230.1 hypothetical protein [Bowmanella yangjiangensis]
MRNLLWIVACIGSFVFGYLVASRSAKPSGSAPNVVSAPSPVITPVIQDVAKAPIAAPPSSEQLEQDHSSALSVDLEKQLQEQQRTIDKQRAQLSKILNSKAYQKALAETIQVTNEDVERDNLPEPFKSFVERLDGHIAEQYLTLLNEPQDQDEAYMLKQNIADFLQMHELSHLYQIENVRCSQSVCEIRGLKDTDSLRIALDALSKQPFWRQNSNSTSSSSSNSKEHGKYLYLLAGRKVVSIPK